MDENSKKIIADWHQKMAAIKAEKRKSREEQKLIIFEYYPEIPAILNYIKARFSKGKYFYSYMELIDIIKDKHNDKSPKKLRMYMIKILKAIHKTGASEHGIIVNKKINFIKAYERPSIKRPIAIRKSSKRLWSESNLIMRARNCQKCGAVLSNDEDIFCLLCKEKSRDEKRESEEDIKKSKKREEW